MSDQTGSSRFHDLFGSALRDYEQKTNIKLVEYPLADQLEKCESVEDITTLLQEQARTLGGSDKIMESIACAVGVLHKLSDMANTIGLVRRRVEGDDGIRVSDTVILSYSLTRNYCILASVSYSMHAHFSSSHLLIL
jgi:hypothetical protein